MYNKQFKMDSLRKWFYKPKAGDRSLLARFFHADRALSAVSSELDSFDGRSEPERCSRLVGRLRQGQDRVLAITGQIMDELLGQDRSPREFRAKFPEEVLQDSLGGQLWFGAECLAAGSSIMNREAESAAMRPLAKAVTKSLDNVRHLLREQCLRNNTPNGPLKLDSNDMLTEMLYESLKIFDRLFAEFELSYVSAMVPVKSKAEYEIQELICVLFSETLQRALKLNLVTQEQVDSFDPALMFSIPRLAIVSGLLVFDSGPLNVDQPAPRMSDMFRPFRSLLHKIRDLLWTLNHNELNQLEKLLCTNEELDLSLTGLSYNHTELVSDLYTECAITKDDVITGFYAVCNELTEWSDENTIPAMESVKQENTLDSDTCSNSTTNQENCGYLIPNTNFGTLLQTESLLSSSFISSGGSTTEINDQYASENEIETLTEFLQTETILNKNLRAVIDAEKVLTQTPVDSGVGTENTSLDRTPDSEHNKALPQEDDDKQCKNQENILLTDDEIVSFQKKYSKNWDNLYKYQAGCSTSKEINNHNRTQSPSDKNVIACDKSGSGEGISDRYINEVTSSNSDTDTSNYLSEITLKSDANKQQLCNSSSNSSSPNVINSLRHKEHSKTTHKSASKQPNGCSESHTSVLSLKPTYTRRTARPFMVNGRTDSSSPSPPTETSSGDTSPFTSDCGDPREVALAIRAAGRARFRSTEDLLHRLFVCIAGVADQLQTNFASDLRHILRSVFLMNTTPTPDEAPKDEQSPSESFEFRASETDIIQNGGSNQSIYSAEEVVIDGGNGYLPDEHHLNEAIAELRRNERSQSVTMNQTNSLASIGRSNSLGNSVPQRNINGSRQNCKVTNNAFACQANASNNNNPSSTRSSPEVIHHIENVVDSSTSSNHVNSVVCDDHSATVPAPAWVPDCAAPRCMACESMFTPFRRRHHCRSCGGVFCGTCSSSSAPLPRFGINKAVRVCDICYANAIGTL